MLHFLLLGALAFAAWPERRPEVRVSPAELAALADAFRSETGREPNPEERETLLARAIDERILARTPALKDGIRRERELLGVARDAARAVRQKDAPRFLDLRA